jgi:hypothetical protein
VSARILLLGRELRPLESIATVGDLLGVSRATAFRLADSDEWPTIGGRGARRVIMPALALKMGLPYEVVSLDEVRDE